MPFEAELLKELKRLNELWHREFKQIEEEVKKLNQSQTASNYPPVQRRQVLMPERAAESFQREPAQGVNLEGRAGFACGFYFGLRKTGYDLQQPW